MNTTYFIILLASLIGLFVASRIHMRNKSRMPVMCPTHGECESVTRSQYSHFLHFPVELLGIAYYVVMIITYVSLMLLPQVAQQHAVLFISSGLSLGAFLFTCYLVFIQAFVIHTFCKWCLTSAAMSTIIFFTSLFALPVPIIEIVGEYSRVILTLHVIGFAIGLGGATITDVFFMKFLKDLKISTSESKILHTLSQVIWFALAIIVISGIGLYLPSAQALNSTPKFLVKVITVAVILVNGVMLNLIVAPKLIKLSFKKKHLHENKNLDTVRKLAYAFGAISITSWYSALILGMVPRKTPIDFGTLLLGYGVLLVVAVTASQLLDHYLSQGNKKSRI